jgi:hypothetical protein
VTRPATFDRVDRVKAAVGQPVLYGDDRLWILGQALTAIVDGDLVTVPRGFTTDGASIPRFGTWLTGWGPWEEPQRWGAIVHDWLYCSSGVSKAWADRAFRAVLASEGAGIVRRWAMYLAVRLFGGHAYRIDQASGPMIYR